MKMKRKKQTEEVGCCLAFQWRKLTVYNVCLFFLYVLYVFFSADRSSVLSGCSGSGREAITAGATFTSRRPKARWGVGLSVEDG